MITTSDLLRWNDISCVCDGSWAYNNYFAIALTIFFMCWCMFLLGTAYEQFSCTKPRHIVHCGLAIFARGWWQGYKVAQSVFGHRKDQKRDANGRFV